MKKRSFIALFLCCVMLLQNISFASFETPPELSLEKCKKVEITLKNEVKGNGITLIDGGSENPERRTYNRPTVFGGEECREITNANAMCFTFDEGFAEADDDVFLFVFRYWDYGGGGLFYLNYDCGNKSQSSNTIEVSKRGVSRDNPMWRTESAIVVGASFGNGLEEGADFTITNRANNAFQKIEVYNLTPIKEELELMELGVYGTSKAKILYNMGLVDGESVDSVTANLGSRITREKAISSIIKMLGLGETANSATSTCRFSDVSEENKKTIAYADSIGLINNNTSTLGAEEFITEKELIEYYLKYFKFPYDSTNIIKSAEENRLIYVSDYIFQPKKTALFDNLMCIAYNATKLTSPDNGEMVVMNMVADGIVTFQQVLKSGDVELSRRFLDEPLYCPPTEHIDESTGRKWYDLNFFGMSIMKPYFTQRAFCQDNERFIFCNYDGFVFEYNIKTHYAKKIAEMKYKYTAMTMAWNTSNFYYISRDNELMKLDMDTYKSEVIFQLPLSVTYVHDLTVTKDETVFGLDINYSDPDATDPRRTSWYDKTTGEFNVTPFKNWAELQHPGYYEMHGNINPVYKNRLYYAVGGSINRAVSALRAWIYDTETGEDGWFFQEYPLGYCTYGEKYGEQNCHEGWSVDGEWMIINKHLVRLGGVDWCVGIPGITLLSKDGRDRKYVGHPTRVVNNQVIDKTICHPGPSSADTRWVVADTDAQNYNKNHTEIYLIDTDSARMTLLGNFPQSWYSDFHPHPHTSPDGNIVIFGMSYIEDGSGKAGLGRIAWMDISDLVNVPPDGERVELSDSCEALDFTGFEYDLEQEKISDEPVYRVKSGKKMYINVKNDVIWGREEDVVLSITYLDKGVAPVKLEYITWHDDRLSNFIRWNDIVFNRENSGKWKTKEIILEDVNMDNMGLLATELKLSGVASDVIIKNVEARAYTKEASNE